MSGQFGSAAMVKEEEETDEIEQKGESDRGGEDGLIIGGLGGDTVPCEDFEVAESGAKRNEGGGGSVLS